MVSVFLGAFISFTSENNCEDETQHALFVNSEGVRGEKKKDEMLQSGKMKGTELHGTTKLCFTQSFPLHLSSCQWIWFKPCI